MAMQTRAHATQGLPRLRHFPEKARSAPRPCPAPARCPRLRRQGSPSLQCRCRPRSTAPPWAPASAAAASACGGCPRTRTSVATAEMHACMTRKNAGQVASAASTGGANGDQPTRRVGGALRVWSRPPLDEEGQAETELDGADDEGVVHLAHGELQQISDAPPTDAALLERRSLSKRKLRRLLPTAPPAVAPRDAKCHDRHGDSNRCAARTQVAHSTTRRGLGSGCP